MKLSEIESTTHRLWIISYVVYDMTSGSSAAVDDIRLKIGCYMSVQYWVGFLGWNRWYFQTTGSSYLRSLQIWILGSQWAKNMYTDGALEQCMSSVKRSQFQDQSWNSQLWTSNDKKLQDEHPSSIILIKKNIYRSCTEIWIPPNVWRPPIVWQNFRRRKLKLNFPNLTQKDVSSGDCF